MNCWWRGALAGFGIGVAVPVVVTGVATIGGFAASDRPGMLAYGGFAFVVSAVATGALIGGLAQGIVRLQVRRANIQSVSPTRCRVTGAVVGFAVVAVPFIVPALVHLATQSSWAGLAALLLYSSMTAAIGLLTLWKPLH